MGNIKVWQKNQKPEEGYFFDDGKLWHVEEVKLGAQPSAPAAAPYVRDQCAVPPEGSLKAPPAPPSQKYVDARYESYFNTAPNGEKVITVYQRHVTKGTVVHHFFATNSKTGERIDVKFDTTIDFKPYERESYDIALEEFYIEKQKEYVVLYVAHAKLCQ